MQTKGDQVMTDFSDIEKALENHFSLHDVDHMMDVLYKYREVESKQEPYDEDGFKNFIKETK